MIPIYFVLLGWKDGVRYRQHTTKEWQKAISALPTTPHLVLRETTKLGYDIALLVGEHADGSDEEDIGRLEDHPDKLFEKAAWMAMRNHFGGRNVTVLLRTETFRKIYAGADLVVCSGISIRVMLNPIHLTLHDASVLR